MPALAGPGCSVGTLLMAGATLMKEGGSFVAKWRILLVGIYGSPRWLKEGNQGIFKNILPYDTYPHTYLLVLARYRYIYTSRRPS